MKKIFYKIHLWLSIPLGIIVTLICLSGALLVFQQELNEKLYPQRYFAADSSEEPISLHRLIRMVNMQLEENSVASVEISSDPTRNYVMGLQKGNRAFIYVDPYTGEVMGQVERGSGFFSVMLRLHRWLMDDSRTTGKAVVGYSTLALLIILISGIVIWWPRDKSALKSRLFFKYRGGSRRFWRDLHVVGGFYMTIGLLVLATTGLCFSFTWWRKGVYTVLGSEVAVNPHYAQKAENQTSSGKDEKEGGNPHRGGSHREGAGRPGDERGTRGGEGSRGGGEGYRGRAGEQNAVKTYHWQAVYDAVSTNAPRHKTITIQNGMASVMPNRTFGNARASDKYTFDADTGEILSVAYYKDQSRAAKIQGWIYSLHVGAWGGLFAKVLTFLIALLGATLPVSGYYLYIVKHRKRSRKRRTE